MANNPISFSDPDGDDFGLSIAIGVGISVLINGINNLRNDQDFFNNWGMAALFGGFSGAFGYGIGNIFDMGILGSGFWNEAARAAVHGYVGGVFAMAQGGKFTHGFASGGIGSGVGSAIGAHGKAAGWSRSGTNFAMIGGAGLSGGFGSSISGGSFWKGFGIGATVGAVNHAMGEIMNGGGGDPWEVIHREPHELGGYTEFYIDGTSAFVSSGGAVQFYNADGTEGPFFMPGGRMSPAIGPHEYFMGGGLMIAPVKAVVNYGLKFRWFRKYIYNEFPSEQGKGYSILNSVRFHTHHIKYHGPHRQLDFNWFGKWYSIRFPR